MRLTTLVTLALATFTVSAMPLSVTKDQGAVKQLGSIGDYVPGSQSAPQVKGEPSVGGARRRGIPPGTGEPVGKVGGVPHRRGTIPDVGGTQNIDGVVQKLTGALGRRTTPDLSQEEKTLGEVTEIKGAVGRLGSRTTPDLSKGDQVADKLKDGGKQVGDKLEDGGKTAAERLGARTTGPSKGEQAATKLQEVVEEVVGKSQEGVRTATGGLGARTTPDTPSVEKAATQAKGAAQGVTSKAETAKGLKAGSPAPKA